MKPVSLPPLILASQSPRRRDLLAGAGLAFDVVIRPTDELLDPALEPQALCMTNAKDKANAVAKEFPDATVIGADTLVFIDSTPLGKPAREDEARAMLTQLSGRVHHVCTAVSVRSPLGDTDFAEMTKVQFRTLTDDDITRYLALVNVYDKAGSYALQEHGEIIIEQVEGDANNVIGLPVSRLAGVLIGMGYPASL